MKIAFIGGGVMGEAMIGGVLRQKLASPESIVASDVSTQRQTALRERYHITAIASNTQACSGSDLVVLAVKPQQFHEVAIELQGRLDGSQGVLSIMAGVSIATLCQELGHQAVVRAMPNTPGQIGEGITVWTATPAVTDEKKSLARSVLSALGEEVFVADERYLDMATALSGSGPAYVFLLLEALMNAGAHIGLPWDIARRLALRTVLGSTKLVEQTGRHPAELKDMVASPGGTTVEGLLRLEEAGVRAALIRAVVAAYDKSRALGGQR